MAILHYYRCSSCGSTLLSRAKARGGPFLCKFCHSYMKFLFSEAVQSPLERDCYQRGHVYMAGDKGSEHA